MHQHNPYLPPNTEIDPTHALSSDAGDVLAAAKRGEYSLDISSVMETAWSLVKGLKFKIFVAIIIIMLANMVIQGLMGAIGLNAQAAMRNQEFAMAFVAWSVPTIVSALLTTPLSVGIQVMAMKHAAGRAHDLGELFAHYPKIFPLFAANLLVLLGTYLGLACLILPGIFISVSLMLTLPLVIAFNLGPWEACVTSFHAIRHQWWSFFGLLIIVGLINLCTVFSLGVALIWTIPFSVLALAVCFIRMFGTNWPGLPQ